jgi:mono/diheme cytochrome c family protein
MNQFGKSLLLLLPVFAAGLATVPVAGAILFSSGFAPLDAVSEPPAWEVRIGQRALKMSLSRRAAGLRNPVEASDAVLMSGMRKFKANCSGCHGSGEGPSHWGNSNFYPRVPQFAQYPPNLDVAEMFIAVKYGIRYSGMFANSRTPDNDIWELVTFLSRMASLPASVDKAWREKQ